MSETRELWHYWFDFCLNCRVFFFLLPWQSELGRKKESISDLLCQLLCLGNCFPLFSLTKSKEDVFHLGKFFFLSSFPHVFQILGTIAAFSPVAGVHPIGWLVFLFFLPLTLFKWGRGYKICVWGTCNNVVMFLVVLIDNCKIIVWL